MRDVEGVEGQAYLEGSQARVFLLGGIAVRRLKRRSAAAAMTPPQQLLDLPQHPNVVRLFAVDIHSGDICMEAMAVSLQQHITLSRQPFDFPDKLHIARSAAQGLRHLHAHGMDHGDLCPANILLAWPASPHGEAQVKLCDFYNARTGTARTAAYAAPEVVTSPPSTMCAADVWAFACCLLFLEGVQPFLGFEDPAVLYYLGVHACVAFKEDGACKPFSLDACAYAPARHIGQTAWTDILAAAFVPEPRRLSSLQLCAKLHALQAAHATHTPHTPHATHTHATHAPPHKTQPHRAPLRRLKFI